jgi:protein TonB
VHALEDEPEKSKRPFLLLAGAALAVALQGGGLYAADKYKPPEKPRHEVIRVAIVQKPPKPEPPKPPPPPEAPKPPPPPPPEPPKVRPKPPPKVKPAEPPPPTPPPPAPEPPKPAPPPPPLVTGLTLESTVAGGKGPAVQVGNTQMGVVGDHAVTAVTKPGVAGGTGDGPIQAPPHAVVRVDAKRKRVDEPPYPPAARAANIEGVVVLVLTIDEEGHVVEAQVVKEPGYGLGESAAKAARQWLYEPATVDGKPVRSKLTQVVRFRLDDN